MSRKAPETRDEVTIEGNKNKNIESAGKRKKYEQIESVEKQRTSIKIQKFGVSTKQQTRAYSEFTTQVLAASSLRACSLSLNLF